MSFYGIYCVPFYSINDCPVNGKWNSCFLDLSFMGFQHFSEGKLYSSTSLIYFYCIAYRNNIVSWQYKFIQGPDGDISEAQINIVELTEVPNFDSKESRFTDFIDVTKGKPRCIILLFYATFYTYYLVHLGYWIWMKT